MKSIVLSQFLQYHWKKGAKLLIEYLNFVTAHVLSIDLLVSRYPGLSFNIQIN